MNRFKYLFRVSAMLLGTILALLLLLELFPYPHLYIDKSAVNVKTVVFTVLVVMNAICAVFFGIYVVRNKYAKGSEIIVPMAGFFICLLAGLLFFNYAGQEVLCSYTTELSDITDRLPYELFLHEGEYYEGKGVLSEYTCFWRGDCGSEEISVVYSQQDYETEQARIESLLGSGNHDDNCVCYMEKNPYLPRLIQVRFYPDSYSVVYGRYSIPEKIPDFVPKPLDTAQTKT